MKTKHNKKRNTAILYELVTRELTDSIVKKDNDRYKFTLSVLKESFGEKTILGRELRCYRDVLETRDVEKYTAERIIHETRGVHGRLNSKKIFDSQTKVINKINKALSKDIWSTFIPNFKTLATISAVFNSNTSAKQRVLHEDILIKIMSSAEKLEEGILQPMDDIIYHSFVKKFNDKYSLLLKEQKNLLNRYIASFSDNGLELNLYLNEEIGRLKNIMTDALQTQEVKSDETMIEKTKKVLSILESFKEIFPTKETIEKVLQIQQLAGEICSDD